MFFAVGYLFKGEFNVFGRHFAKAFVELNPFSNIVSPYLAIWRDFPALSEPWKQFVPFKCMDT